MFNLLLPVALVPSVRSSASFAPFTSHSLIISMASKSRPNQYMHPRSPYILHKRSNGPMRVGSEDYVHSAGFDHILGNKFSRMNSYELMSMSSQTNPPVCNGVR